MRLSSARECYPFQCRGASTRLSTSSTRCLSGLSQCASTYVRSDVNRRFYYTATWKSAAPYRDAAGSEQPSSRAPASHGRSSGRIVVPALPSDTKDFLHALEYDVPSSFLPREHAEYVQYRHPSSQLVTYLPEAEAQVYRQQTSRSMHQQEVDRTLDKVWRDSKPHLRKHEALVQQLGGAEAAAHELVHPTRLSFREELAQRPLDKSILEEIYVNLHGKRIERKLKKGVSWEHWITKGEGTAPVFTASRKAQQAFGMGGHIRRLALATDVTGFPSSSATAPHRTNPKSSRSVPEAAGGPPLGPEFAFIGRTSSGKSSLINAIVNAAVAPYGHLQGTTTAVSFYSVAGKALTLVDCPGYGYYNPMMTPTVEATNAVRVMRDYLDACATRRSSAAPAKRQQTAETEEGLDGEVEQSPQQSVKNSKKKKKKRNIGHESDRTGRSSEQLHYHTGLEPRRDSKQQTHEHETEEDLKAEEGKRDEDDDSFSAAPRRGRHSTTTIPPRPLRRVFLCVPSRGLQHLDWAYCDVLESRGIPFTVVLTKTDAAPIRFLARLADYTRCRLVQYQHCKELMLTSSLRLAGIDKMQNLIGSMAQLQPPSGDANQEEVIDFSSIV